MGHVAASEEMSFKGICINGDACFHRCHPAVNNQADRNPAQTHTDELGKGDRSVREFGAEPRSKKIQEDHHDDQANQ